MACNESGPGIKNHRYCLKRVFSLPSEMPHHADRSERFQSDRPWGASRHRRPPRSRPRNPPQSLSRPRREASHRRRTLRRCHSSGRRRNVTSPPHELPPAGRGASRHRRRGAASQSAAVIPPPAPGNVTSPPHEPPAGRPGSVTAPPATAEPDSLATHAKPYSVGLGSRTSPPTEVDAKEQHGNC
jgi:hypothetical protein